MKTRYIITSVLLLVISMLALTYLFPSEEKKVKKQFGLLSEWVAKDPGESALTMARKAQNIGTLFAERCNLSTNISSFSGTYTPREISNLAAQVRLQFSELSLRFYDLKVDFPKDRTAKVTLTARLTGILKTAELIDNPFEIGCILDKNQDKWLFRDCRVIEVLKR